MSVRTYYLVVSNGRVPRVLVRRPYSRQIKSDEIVYPLEVAVDDLLGKVVFGKALKVNGPIAPGVNIGDVLRQTI